MSVYQSSRLDGLTPYTPGEQPRDRRFIKLNTNESPFPPAKRVTEAVKTESEVLMLYSDPDSTDLRRAMRDVFRVPEERIIMTNGSDEVLFFAFAAFADEKRPLIFPDITYGFYPVFADLLHIPYEELPLREDFTVDPDRYLEKGKTVVIANPNAPTGISLPLGEIERIVKSDPDRVVIVDEAYVDFGGESALPLIERYENLLVVGTFSKSRSMAGARLGFAFGSEKLIGDLNTVRNSVNPYNVNRLTSAAGIAALAENDHYMANCRRIMEIREWTRGELETLGFEVLPSCANFLFVRKRGIGGEELYRRLREKGILVRHFGKPRITDFNRITIGSMDQMESLVCAVKEILEEDR